MLLKLNTLHTSGTRSYVCNAFGVAEAVMFYDTTEKRYPLTAYQLITVYDVGMKLHTYSSCSALHNCYTHDLTRAKTSTQAAQQNTGTISTINFIVIPKKSKLNVTQMLDIM